ncbi:TPA: hypothetical protein N0F65_008787 [Lagenidium giganteum]|uniref:PB1 domain-containing protein n=1 Tax=Lagenidium giganteum TaxID=4803 RepID=A0AAV2YZG8_9STRA|nr:TPA: hypothetical protein N0F65_008787 [Lagenidium giganteum]
MDADSSMVAVKLSYGGETHRVKTSLDEITFAALVLKVEELFPTRPAVWTFVYTDNEGDLVTANSDAELMEACRVFLKLQNTEGDAEEAAASGAKRCLHFHVVSKTTLKDRIAPVVHAVEEFSATVARVASETTSSLQSSTYVERGRESLVASAAQTRGMLESARLELSQRFHNIQVSVAEEIRERTQPTESQQAADDVTDVVIPVRMARRGPRSSRRQNENGEVASDAETDPESDEEAEEDQDWDVVSSEQGSEQSVDGFAEQVAMVRQIIPHVETRECHNLLVKHQGNLEAVLLELTD